MLAVGASGFMGDLRHPLHDPPVLDLIVTRQPLQHPSLCYLLTSYPLPKCSGKRSQFIRKASISADKMIDYDLVLQLGRKYYLSNAARRERHVYRTSRKDTIASTRLAVSSFSELH